MFEAVSDHFGFYFVMKNFTVLKILNFEIFKETFYGLKVEQMVTSFNSRRSWTPLKPWIVVAITILKCVLVMCSLSCVRMKKIEWSCEKVSEKIIHFEWNSIIEDFEFWMTVLSEVSHICIIRPSIEFCHEIFLLNAEYSK